MKKILLLVAGLMLVSFTASAVTLDEYLDQDYQRLTKKIETYKATPDASCATRLQRYEQIKTQFDKIKGNPAEKTALVGKIKAFCDSQCKTGGTKFTYNGKEMNELVFYTVSNPGTCTGDKPDSGTKWFFECNSCKDIK